MMSKENREYRDLYEILKINEENEGEMVVEGYASTFEQPYRLWEDKENQVELWEVVDKNAFANTNMDDVIFQYNHEGRVFARKRNNTLEVQPNEEGLLIRANLGGTTIGRQLYEEIKGGYTDKMSFGFTVDADVWVEENQEDGSTQITRRITSIGKLYDVSAVSIPANDSTSISVRSLTDGVIQKVQAERLEQKRKAELHRQLEERLNKMKGESR